MSSDWKTQLQAEFERAETARTAGKEGRARVCARRAAGVAIREYFRRRGIPIRTPSAYELLNLLARQPDLSADLRQAAIHLTSRLTAEFRLPLDVDLIAEARRLCNALLLE